MLFSSGRRSSKNQNKYSKSELSKSMSYQGHYIANQNLDQVFCWTKKSNFAKLRHSLTAQFLSRLFHFSSRLEFQVGHPKLLFEPTYNFDNHWSKMHLNFFFITPVKILISDVKRLDMGKHPFILIITIEIHMYIMIVVCL